MASSIFDMTLAGVGPFATMELAGMGADVIKFEAPSGDGMQRVRRASTVSVACTRFATSVSAAWCSTSSNRRLASRPRRSWSGPTSLSKTCAQAWRPGWDSATRTCVPSTRRSCTWTAQRGGVMDPWGVTAGPIRLSRPFRDSLRSTGSRVDQASSIERTAFSISSAAKSSPCRCSTGWCAGSAPERVSASRAPCSAPGSWCSAPG